MATGAYFPALVPARAGRAPINVDIWPLVVVLYGTFLPMEVRITAGPLELYGYRIALMIALPWVVLMLMRGAIKLVLPDFLMILGGIWMSASMMYNTGFVQGLQSGGALTFDLLSAYFLARISLRSHRSITRLLAYLLPAVVLSGALLMIESVSHKLIFRPWAEAVFGNPHVHTAIMKPEVEIRSGLMRAYGMFPHPIVGGLEMSSFLAPYLFSTLSSRQKILGCVAAFMSIFTLSSAAIASLVMTVGLIIFEYAQRIVKELTWSWMVGATFVFLMAAELFSKSGLISVIIRFGTFDPETGYYRLLIWNYAGAQVLVNPWMGSGFSEYTRPLWMHSDSIDAHWLALAVRHGLPCSLAIAGAVLCALFMLSFAVGKAKKSERPFFIGLAISLAVMSIQMFTVTLWAGPGVWFTVLVGAVVGSARSTETRSPEHDQPDAIPARR